MKLTFSLIAALAFFLLSYSSHAQLAPGAVSNAAPAQPWESALVREIDSLNAHYPLEKVYLHIDRNSYWATDDIWFKAYLKNSPVTETNLYVELLTPEGKIMQRKTYLAINGLAYGDFHVPDTTASGVYQIRAYTNWMRNFDPGCLFRKNIAVWNLADKTYGTGGKALGKPDIDVQFFPEGGTFVANVGGRVAFKAVDQNGRGIDIDGHVEDARGDTVTTIKSVHKGMGSFMLTPVAGERYRARIWANGTGHGYVKLPEASSSGYSFAVNPMPDGRIFMQVSHTPNTATDTLGNEIVITGQTNGALVFTKHIRLENGRYMVQLQKSQLPSGVLQLTVFDSNKVPCCERLVFVNNNDHITLGLNTDKATYTAREKAVLSIGELLPCGLGTTSNLSVSVVNLSTQLEVEKYPNNILSHFLLKSELKGLVEEPGYYFKDDSASTQQSLDNLMLTQGWRQFVQNKPINGTAFDVAYEPETSITIKGNVRKIWADKPIANSKVSLLFLKKQKGFFSTVADNKGRFRFDNLYFYDSVYYAVQARTPLGSKNTWVEIDSTSSVPPQSLFLPENNIPGTKQGNKQATDTTTQLASANSTKIKRKWSLSDTILLDEHKVVGKKPIKDDGHVRPYIKADWVLDVAKEDPIYDIFEAASYKFPNFYYNPETHAMSIRNNDKAPLLILDGAPTNVDMILSIRTRDIDKLEMLAFAPMYGAAGNNGVINVFTKQSWQYETVEQIESKGVRKGTTVGYSTIRKFYEPKYGPEQPPAEKKDYRGTIYWNPLVKTTPEGKAELTFYNNDQIGEVEVVVEGINANGKICRGTIKYNVGIHPTKGILLE